MHSDYDVLDGLRRDLEAHVRSALSVGDFARVERLVAQMDAVAHAMDFLMRGAS